MADMRETVKSSFRNFSRDLYPKLVLYEALVGYQGDHKRRGEAKSSHDEARRDFLDSFAYLCDIRKGGSTVTSAAVQRLEYSNFLWLSANEGVQPRVLRHAEKILDNLKQWDTESEEVLRTRIFQLAITACEPRIKTYKEKVQLYAENCRIELEKECYNETGKKSKARFKQVEVFTDRD